MEYLGYKADELKALFQRPSATQLHEIYVILPTEDSVSNLLKKFKIIKGAEYCPSK